MTTVICAIAVAFSANGLTWFGKTTAEGSLIKQGAFNQLVDFSSEAKKNGWVGDYSKVLVERKDCI